MLDMPGGRAAAARTNLYHIWVVNAELKPDACRATGLVTRLQWVLTVPVLLL